MELCSQREVRSLLERYGFHFSKSMGQNFLIESWVPQQTAEASGVTADMGVLEVGPGVGPLTEQLAKRAKKVVSVELDKRLLPVLAETLAEYPNVEIVPGDILKTDIQALCQEKLAGLPVVACANLPYNITTPVLTVFLTSGCFQSITVMIQKEVAQRICARAGSPEYGAFTVFCQYYADCQLLYDVPPSCFYPAPKVTSAVLHMAVREKPPETVSDPSLFFRVVRGAFGQRRKTLLNGLHAALGMEKEHLKQALLACDLPEAVRGEALDFAAFARLTQVLSQEKEAP